MLRSQSAAAVPGLWASPEGSATEHLYMYSPLIPSIMGWAPQNTTLDAPWDWGMKIIMEDEKIKY